MIEETLKARVKDYETKWQEAHKVYGRIANLRLIVLVVCIGLLYLLFSTYQTIWMLVIVILSVGGFCYLVKRHQVTKEVLDACERMKRINEKYLARLDEGWKAFDDTGEDLLDVNHPYAYDLDIVGKDSLFQKINITHTWHGRQQLKNDLLQPNFNEEVLATRQKAINELVHNLTFCQRLEAVVGKGKHDEKTTKRLLAYAQEEKHFFKKSWSHQVVFILPWLVIGCLLVGYGLKNTTLWSIAAILMIGNYLYQVLFLAKISEAKGILTAVMYDLTTYKEILEILHEETFTSAYLEGLTKRLCLEGHDALEGIKAIEKLGNRAQIAYQPIVAIPLNAIGLWDLKVVLQLEKWQRQYGVYLEEWLQVIGEMESLVSLSMLGHLEKVSFPLVEEKGRFVEGTTLGHPLIPLKERVCNDVHLKDEIFVITGSNMSGKTTFLRTIGINLVLAYAGAPVVANRLRTTRLAMYTSMRIRDDLSQGISTFYAELTRIKMIVEAAKEETDMLFLIDEIFRGTNSVDRIIGAKSVVKAVKDQGAIGAITTHDLELCQLEDQGKIANYHFTDSYRDGGIAFDYQLKHGPSTTTNAQYLMQMVGIPLIEC